MSRFLRHLLLPAFIGMVIFVLTCILTPNDIPQMPDVIPWDKLVHLSMFFVLSIVCYYDYFQLNEGNVRKGRWIFWGFVIPVLYGGAIELLQKYVFTSRSADILDFLADMIGSFVATFLSIYMLNRKQKLKKSLPLQQNLRK